MNTYISDFTGEIHEGLLDLITDMVRTVWMYRKQWSKSEIIRYIIQWRVF